MYLVGRSTMLPKEIDEIAELSELKKHVAAIHINNKLSLLQHKIANILLLLAYDDLLTKEEHTVKIGQLAKLAGFDSNDHDLLKQSLIVLTETSLQWDILSEAGRKGEWGVSSMLAQAVIDKGECRYAYSPELRRKLYKPEIYARINLAVQQTFTSGYALKLYENCVRYREVRSTGWWSIKIFKSLLGINEDEYRNFKDLNKWIIKPSIAQINENSDIIVDVEYKRENRKIVKLRFHVNNNPQLLLKLSIRKQLLSGVNQLESEITEVAKADSSRVVLDRLQQFGLSEKEAQTALARYGESYVIENLEIIEPTYLAGKVESLPAFTKAALKADYRPKLSPIELTQLNSKQNNKTHQEQFQQAQQQLESLQVQFEKYRLEEALQKLSKEEMNTFKEEFIRHYEHHFLFRKWILKGWENPIVQGMFRNFAVEKLLTKPSESEFTTFVNNQGYDLNLLNNTVK